MATSLSPPGNIDSSIAHRNGLGTVYLTRSTLLVSTPDTPSRRHFEARSASVCLAASTDAMRTGGCASGHFGLMGRIRCEMRANADA